MIQGDAEALAGTALDSGQLGDPSSPSCTYNGPISGPEAQVQVFFGDGAKKTLEVERTIGHVLNPVDGLGDEAFEEDYNIYFRATTMWVEIHLVRLSGPASFRAPLEALASKIAKELSILGI